MVIDTNVLVAGLRSRRGASFAVLEKVAGRLVTPLVSVSLFLEYEAVLKRSEQRSVHGFSESEIDGLLGAFALLAEPVDVHFLWRPQLRDPADELVLEAAVNGRADAIVTHNSSDFLPAAHRFGLEVVGPARLLKGNGP